ncbi:hypothetical protein [Fulvivirga imtechensis]|nr:hypothetical protein [Fulvivirga imtechensis]
MEISITSLEQLSKSAILERFIEALNDRNLTYYAQDWMKSMGYANMDELHHAISPLIDAMTDAHIDASENIKLVYRCDQGRVYEDWKLSLLGLTYLALNSPHKTKKMNRLQFKIISDYLSNRKKGKKMEAGDIPLANFY